MNFIGSVDQSFDVKPFSKNTNFVLQSTKSTVLGNPYILAGKLTLTGPRTLETSLWEIWEIT